VEGPSELTRYSSNASRRITRSAIATPSRPMPDLKAAAAGSGKAGSRSALPSTFQLQAFEASSYQEDRERATTRKITAPTHPCAMPTNRWLATRMAPKTCCRSARCSIQRRLTGQNWEVWAAQPSTRCLLPLAPLATTSAPWWRPLGLEPRTARRRPSRRRTPETARLLDACWRPENLLDLTRPLQ